jgi:hypothetical protein
MCVPINSQDDYNVFDIPNNAIYYGGKDIDDIDQIIQYNKEQVLENAIDFILETQKDNDYICEMNGEWCETHCIDTLRKGCIIHYLKENLK